jgi:foldase protein PrsA
MRPPTDARRFFRSLTPLCLALSLSACGGSRPSSGDSGDQAPPASAAAAPTGRPLAIIAGTSVYPAELQPLLAEAGGARVLEEVTLARLLDTEMARAGLTVSEDDIQREAKLLRDTLGQTVGLSPDDAAALVSNVRAARGLGDRRFRLMLERNARLRALVRADVQVSEDDLRSAYIARHGPKYSVRIVVVPTQTKAAEIKTRTLAGESFIDIAVRESSDPSSQRGGLLDPFSTADPQLPVALRQAVGALSPGQVSDPVIVENGFAIAKVEQVIPGSGASYDAVRPTLETEVRVVRERILMERLAGRLLQQAQITVFDRELEWAWRNRARREDGQR